MSAGGLNWEGEGARRGGCEISGLDVQLGWCFFLWRLQVSYLWNAVLMQRASGSALVALQTGEHRNYTGTALDLSPSNSGGFFSARWCSWPQPCSLHVQVLSCGMLWTHPWDRSLLWALWNLLLLGFNSSYYFKVTLHRFSKKEFGIVSTKP